MYLYEELLIKNFLCENRIYIDQTLASLFLEAFLKVLLTLDNLWIEFGIGSLNVYHWIQFSLYFAKHNHHKTRVFVLSRPCISLSLVFAEGILLVETGAPHDCRERASYTPLPDLGLGSPLPVLRNGIRKFWLQSHEEEILSMADPVVFFLIPGRRRKVRIVPELWLTLSPTAKRVEDSPPEALPCLKEGQRTVITDFTFGIKNSIIMGKTEWIKL